MALVQTVLEAAIIAAFKDQTVKKDNPDAAIEDLAKKLASAIDSYIKSATVVYTAGLVAPPTGGPVTGTLNHTIT